MDSKSFSLPKRCAIFRRDSRDICPDCSKRFILPNETPHLSASSFWEYPLSFLKTRTFCASRRAISEGCLSIDKHNG